MEEQKYFGKEAYKEKYSYNKKEKSKGIIQKFFDLWRFSEDESYY